MVDKNKAITCCLLATSAIMLSEKKKRKRKMWSKKWNLERNISCDAHPLNELLETDVPWDDAIVVSAGKLRKLWDSLSELRSSLCEGRLGRTVLRPELPPVKTAQWTAQFSVWRTAGKDSSEAWVTACQNCAVHTAFPSGMTSHSKIAHFNWECTGRFSRHNDQLTGLNGPEFEPWQEQKIYCFFKTLMPSLRPTQPPIQWVPGFFPVG
jgi:hypothetical protein